MTESRAVCVRVFDYTPRLEQLTFLAAREAFGVPAEFEFDNYPLERGYAKGETLVMSDGRGQPEISVRHRDGAAVANPRGMASDTDPAIVVWVADDKVDVPTAVAHIGEKLDRFGVSWDAHEWTGPGSQMTPMLASSSLDVARQAFPTAAEAVDRPPLQMPKPAHKAPSVAPTRSLRRNP